jgi:DnaJ domain
VAAVSLAGTVSYCAACGYVAGPGSPRPSRCPDCGAPLGKAVRGGVVEVPAGAIPCSRCGAHDVPLLFRGWSRVYAFFLSVRETRTSAYVCARCGEKQTAASLLTTAFMGWWSLQSLFWHAPRATYFNWRAVWAAPRDPLSWGAIPLADLLQEIGPEEAEPQQGHEDRGTGEEGPFDDPPFEDSPLRHLSAAEEHRVLEAGDLYGVLGVGMHASETEVKAAWRDRAKANHPDLNPGDSGAADRMLAVNQAFEILGDPRLRAAYDWLVATRGRPW